MSGGTSFAKSDIGFFLALAAFSIAVLFGPMALGGYLYHDTLRQYSFFYENLDSLNRFAEPAWWSPQINYGTPSYFYALLGISNIGKPVFVALGLLAWLLGRLGIALPPLFPVFMLYLGVLVPLLFLIACAVFLRVGAVTARWSHLSEDPDAYRLIAENVVQRGVFSRSGAT